MRETPSTWRTRERRRRASGARRVGVALAAAVTLAAAVALAGCDRGAPPRAPATTPLQPSTPSPTPGGPPDDGAAEFDEAPAPPPIWPDALPSLDADLARRETPAECATRIRGSLLPEVAEAIAGMGYEQFVADVCGALAAIRAGDVTACDALSLSSARAGCRRRLALVHRRPEACPDDVSVSGREPVCLAWAARDALLCRGASIGERNRCEAVLARDPRRCRGLPSSLQSSCRSDVERLGTALGDVTSTTASVVPALALTLSPTLPPPAVAPRVPRAEDSGADDLGPADDTDARFGGPTPPVIISSPGLERGVVAARCADGVRVRVGDPRRRGSPAMLDGPATAELLLRLPAEAPAGPLRLRASALDVRLLVRIPHVGEGTSDDDRRGEVVLDAHAVRRGATLSGRVDLTVTLDGEPAHVAGTFTTFVRDILDGNAPECAL